MSRSFHNLRALAAVASLGMAGAAHGETVCKRTLPDGSLLLTNLCGQAPRESSVAKKRRIASYETYIAEACHQYNISQALVHAVIDAESDFSAKARSNKGALGLMQLMPATATDLDRRRWIEWLRQNPNLSEQDTSKFISAFVRGRATDDEILDPETNIKGGVSYLKMLAAQFNDDFDKTVAAYNAGPEAVIKAGGVPNIPETQDYVQKVKRLYWRYKAQAAAKVTPAATPASTDTLQAER